MLRFSTDQVMSECFKRLQLDLAAWARPELCALQNLKDIREYEFTFRWARPYAMKCNAQLVGWLKRYRFENDLFSDSELAQRTNEKFLADQVRIATHTPITYRSTLVLQRARVLVRNVLGSRIDWDAVYPFCRFSRNATVGFSGELVYLDEKINPDATLTGTAAEVRWFKDYLRGDPLLRSTWGPRPLPVKEVTSLKQVNVPKTAIIMRPVRPNTLIGSYITYGVGKFITEKIRSELNINLNRLQEKHQYWARKGSFTMKNATADLSAASDSFTSSLMNRLLPRGWFTELNNLRTPYVTIDGDAFRSPSFMAMGIGYTFPLMSLLFYCLLVALRDLAGIDGLVSVFGDDLIYPRKLHPYVEVLFEDLNFKLNPDKTFHDIPFRESCGGDYYEGVDVRPARPEGVCVEMRDEVSICAYVFKLYNSLKRRWEECELPETFRYLKQVARNFGLDYSVPDHFPDESGFKDGLWREKCTRELDSLNRRVPFLQGFAIACLIGRADVRPVGFQTIFLHEKLRPKDSEPPFLKRDSSDVLLWRWKKYRCRTTNRRYRKLVAFTTKRGCVFVHNSKQIFS